MPAVALTDTDGLYAVVPFYQAAKKAGVKPIVGVVLDVEWSQDRREIPRFARNDGNNPSTTLVLLAMNMEGYSNLCELVTLRHLGTTKLSQNMNSAETDGRPVTLQELAEHSRGVIALCPLPGRSRDASIRRGTIHRAPTEITQANGDRYRQGISSTNHESLITSHFSRLKEIFGDRLYIEVQHLSQGEGRVLHEAERLGRELGVPLV